MEPDAMTVRIPGEPIGQGRPRAAIRAGHAVVYDPQESRQWKAMAHEHYLRALEVMGLRPPFVAQGPIELRMICVFTCPKGDHRKNSRYPRRWSTKAPDLSNMLKIVEDAGNGVLWLDDSQIAREVVEKWIGEPDEAPFIEVTIAPLQMQQAVPIVRGEASTAETASTTASLF